MRFLAVKTVLAGAAMALAASTAHAQTAAMTNTSDDPYLWLEDKDGASVLAWVEAENKRTLARLESDPRYATFYHEALTIASAEDRIPMPGQLMGRIVNFWRDAGIRRGCGDGPPRRIIATLSRNGIYCWTSMRWGRPAD